MTAVISDCGRYRYRLDRDLGGGALVAWIMVNPSTADAEHDDATIRKVTGFSERMYAGRLVVGNLFAYRATDINELKTAEDPVGPENLKHLLRIIHEADRVMFAWGALAKLPPQLRGEWRNVDRIARAAKRSRMCLGICADGHPAHPLMLGYDTEVVNWNGPPL